MQDITNRILQNIIVIINSYREDESQETRSEHAMFLKEDFLLLKKNNILKNFYENISHDSMMILCYIRYCYL